MMLVASLLIALAAPPSGSAGGSAAAAATPGEEVAEADLDKLVCRRESVIGSRVQKRRVCMTLRERLRLEQGTRDGVADYLKKSTAGGPPGG